MQAARQIRITLSEEMAELVRTKIASGEYADESEVVCDGLRSLQHRDGDVEAWLLNEVVPAYDSMRAHPTQAISSKEMRGILDKLAQDDEGIIEIH